MDTTEMTAIITNKIKGKDIPPAWFKNRPIDPEETFRVTLVPERDHRQLSRLERNQLLDTLERSFGDEISEDSEAWIKKIKSARTRSELKIPLS